MNSNERVDEFLKLQEKGISFEDIASSFGVKPNTLKKDLNKRGYKFVKGKYIQKLQKQESMQVVFEEAKSVENKKTSKDNNKVTSKESIQKITKKNNKVTKPKKDKKINLTQEDLDKLCEVYDWYLQVKDFKALKRKKIKNDITVDFEFKEEKSINLKVDKDIWEDFLRLCSNSSYDRKTIITQALKDFMKVYKDLL